MNNLIVYVVFKRFVEFRAGNTPVDITRNVNSLSKVCFAGCGDRNVSYLEIALVVSRPGLRNEFTCLTIVFMINPSGSTAEGLREFLKEKAVTNCFLAYRIFAVVNG